MLLHVNLRLLLLMMMRMMVVCVLLRWDMLWCLGGDGTSVVVVTGCTQQRDVAMLVTSLHCHTQSRQLSRGVVS